MSHEVVAAFIVRSDRILLGRRSPLRVLYPNVWDMFGGHVESGEEHEQTLFRELQEELGITPTRWAYLETLTQPIPPRDNEPAEELIAHLYRVSAWAGTPVNLQPQEHSAIGWFSLAQAIQLDLADPIYPALFARYLKSENRDELHKKT